jgi:hypothetical protein
MSRLTIEQTSYMLKHQDEYPEGFFHWLTQNQHIWKAFNNKALMMATYGKRKRYSARTIIEVMRWDSDLREKNKLFKISNNMVPGLARLWMAKHGANHPKFFSIRG